MVERHEVAVVLDDVVHDNQRLGRLIGRLKRISRVKLARAGSFGTHVESPFWRLQTTTHGEARRPQL